MYCILLLYWKIFITILQNLSEMWFFNFDLAQKGNRQSKSWVVTQIVTRFLLMHSR